MKQITSTHNKKTGIPTEKLTTLSSVQLERMSAQVNDSFLALLNAEHIDLNGESETLLSTLYIPLADWLVQRCTGTIHFTGINGAQGSGKSTLCKILSLLLSELFNKRVATLSIDDLYFTRNERLHLSQDVHPLLITRGVPGTHDIKLGLEIFQQLRQTAGEIKLPRFDKSIDDQVDRSAWPAVTLPIDIVLFEGWCVATKAESDEKLDSPVNALEQNEDSDGRWRKFVNQQLNQIYPPLFEQLNTLIMLEVPTFNKVIQWRSKQEDKLRDQPDSQNKKHIMNDVELSRFIAHYERLTRANLAEMTQRADLRLQLNEEQKISAIAVREEK
ncbi:MAG: kinase [Chromatiales bacterium]|nr:kinase [Chromatiales bacterium]